jgi:hypothetical protein
MARLTSNALLSAALGLAACVGTRTGNPYEKAPEYTTSSRFAPDAPTTPGTDNGGVTNGPWGNPLYELRAGSLVAAFERYVALAVSGRGVLTVDVVDPEAPVIAGELPIDGTILQLAAAGEGVTVAVRERTTLDVTELPNEPLPREMPRLVHVDLADPVQPRRAFEVDLEGELFGIQQRGSDTIVVAAFAQTQEAWCGGGGGLLIDDGWRPATMRVTRFSSSAGAFVQEQSVELTTDVGGVLAAGAETYLVVDDYMTDAPLVRWVELAEGSLVEGQPFGVNGKPRAADRLGELLALVLEQGDGSLSLVLYTLDGRTAQERGRVGLPARDTSAVTLLASGAAIIDGDGAPALVVDLASLDAPRVGSQLPDDVMRLAPAPTGLIGLGSSGGPGSSGSLVVSLWDGSDPGALRRLSRVQTDGFYPAGTPGHEPWTIDAARGLLLVPFQLPEADPREQVPLEGQVDTAEHLGVFTIGPDTLALHSEQPSRTQLWRPWTDGTSVFSLAYPGFEVLPLALGARQEEPVSALLTLWSDLARPIAELDVDGTRVALRERKEDGGFYLEVGDAGADPSVVELPHRGDALVQVGDRVVVLGMRGVASECESFAAQGIDPSELPELVDSEYGVDPCGARRARGVSIVDPTGEPRIVASLPFVSAMDVEPLDGVHVRAELDGYVPLEDGRILLLAQRTRQCSSYASCELLGVPAYESMATPGCSSDRDCSDQPSVITLVSGYESTLVVYVLDGVGSGSPTLVSGAALEGRFELFDEGPLDVRRKLLSSTGTLAFTRAEPVYNDEGNSIPDAHGDSIVRHFLDRVVLHDDGTLEALAPVSTPGLPIALRDDAVFSIEPRRDDDEGSSIEVVLHRAGLHGAGAFIESSVGLGTGFASAYVQGEHAYALRLLGDPCEPGTDSELSAAALRADGELTLGDRLELPTVAWRFAGPEAGDDDTLWLAGGPHPDARLALDLADPARPSIRRYATPAPR